MCKYSDGIWKCPHEALPNSEYCIFHLNDENKDVEEFNKGINEILESDEEIINFNGFIFPSKSSDFSKKQFHKDVIFDNVVFSGDADFFRAEFSEKADFVDATFSEKANFKEAKFLEKADFVDATFSGDAYFSAAKFSGNAIFHSVTFTGNTTFRGATFSGDAYFSAAKFCKADFRVAEFSERAYFSAAKFSGDVDFSQAELHGIFYFIPQKSKVIKFNDTFFSDKVIILANLSQCSFYGSNIEKVDLTGSTWNNEKIKGFKLLSRIYNYSFNSSITIWEASQGELALNWKALEGIYRRLKQSYQKSGNYEASGEFYIQEKECKRKQLGFFSRHSWNLFYRGFCLYGERPYNVILVSIFILLFFTISYLFNGIEFTESGFANFPVYVNYDLYPNSFDFQNMGIYLKHFMWCGYTSVITFTTLGYGDVHPVGWSRLFASIESGIGIFMTALFIFVFSRKMIR